MYLILSTPARSGMAVCLTVMMGRLGGTFGVNLVALLIEDHCELTFAIASSIILACGLLTFGIPNIMHGADRALDAAAVSSSSPDRKRISIATVEGAMKSSHSGKSAFPQLTQ